LLASISFSEALDAIRRSGKTGAAGLSPNHLRALGEEQPDDFFRLIVEPLADSFDPSDALAYEQMMRLWIPAAPRVAPCLPKHLETVYVLSRVTLGADIKITSMILDAMKQRFSGVAVVLVGGRKSAELFASDPGVSHLEVEYPRSGAVSLRVDFASELRRKLEAPCRIVIDPDSRLTQLGLITPCESEHYFHFPSRTAASADNLSQLTRDWLLEAFGMAGQVFIAPEPIRPEGPHPRVAVSLGVGENPAKRIGGDFETQLIQRLGERYRTIWIDRGAGGDEARRVTAAAQASGMVDRIRFWEGSFAGFASIISECDLYVGYDSAGQHAAAAAGVSLISIFAGAPSERFRLRWSPHGPGPIHVIDVAHASAAECLEKVTALLGGGGLAP
jgi:ADP-heptose:LPS heptosyltransferase